MVKSVTIADEHTENDTIINNFQSIKNVEWSYDNEEMLAEWCDIAQCYRWLYSRTHSYYARLHAWYTIPSIIFSTISGTASFAQTSLPINAQVYAPMVIGTINIIIGILATIQQYLKVSELKESHRIASIGWDKFSRNISIELSKTPDERTSAGSFLKFNRQEFDRLMESNQIIPRHIIKKFNRVFKGKTVEEQHNFEIITKPDVCNSIVSVHSKRHLWFSTREDGTMNKNRSRRSSIDSTLPSFLLNDRESTKSRNSYVNITSELPRPNINSYVNTTSELPRPNINSYVNTTSELPRPNINFNIRPSNINEKNIPDIPHPSNINENILDIPPPNE